MTWLVGVVIAGGLKSSESRWTSIFVDCRPCWCWSIWPNAVAGILGKCFDTFSYVNPGQVVKLPFRIALSNVNFVGLNKLAYKYCNRFVMFCFFGIITFILFVYGGIFLFNGISHNPSEKFLWPVKIHLQFLKTFKRFFVSIIVQLSLASCPKEMRDVCNRGTILAFCAVSDKAFYYHLTLAPGQ